MRSYLSRIIHLLRSWQSPTNLLLQLFTSSTNDRFQRFSMNQETLEQKIPAEKLVRVTFLPEGKTVEFEFGTLPYEHHGKPMSFLDVAENQRRFFAHACGGVRSE